MPAKSRPKTHKHKPGKFSMAEVHKLHKYAMKKLKAPSMKFRRGRTGKGMTGGAEKDWEDYHKESVARGDEDRARDMMAKGHSVAEIRKMFPYLR